MITGGCAEGTFSSIKSLGKDSTSCWLSYIAPLFWTVDHYCTCKTWALSPKTFLSPSVYRFLESL